MIRVAKLMAIAGIALLTIAIAPLIITELSRSQSSVTASTLTYQLEWDWGQATPDEAGGWTVVNDLGYTIHLETGYLVSYSAQLIECEHEHTASRLDTLIAPFVIKSAAAGHGGDTDPSEIDGGLVESLSKPHNQTWGNLQISQTITYCQAHYLIARAGTVAQPIPTEVDMLGASLWLQGTYQAPDSPHMIPFVIKTSLANGTIAEFATSEALTTAGIHPHVVTDGASYTIHIRRSLDTLFDGVDFATMSEAQIGKSLVWSLVAHTQITMQLNTP